MTNAPRAIQATFHTYRHVPSRKVLQLVLEVPEEHGNQAVQMLSPTGTWCAIAPLDMEKVQAKEPERPHKSWHELPPAQQAAIRCGEPAFWTFLREQHDANCHDAADAAKFVRAYCGVKSRKELTEHPEKAEAWHKLDLDFRTWREAVDE